MENLHTATGKEFECDFDVTSPNPPRLYIHLMNATLPDIAVLFSTPGELPLREHPEYRELCSVENTPNGVNVVLKP